MVSQGKPYQSVGGNSVMPTLAQAKLQEMNDLISTFKETFERLIDDNPSLDQSKEVEEYLNKLNPSKIATDSVNSLCKYNQALDFHSSNIKKTFRDRGFGWCIKKI